MKTKKHVREELLETREALRNARAWDSEEDLRRIVKDGYYHLRELRADPQCNPAQENDLIARIERIEAFLEGKKRQRS